MNKEIAVKQDVLTTLHVDSHGIGRMVPTTTTLLVLLATLEEGREEQLSVIASLIEEAGFSAEDIAVYFRNQKKRKNNINWYTEETMEKYSWEIK